ncbi:hypothetical protein PG993_009816 [Apiospora rasikravindrae]|uniref:Uncharacterized protein n=1 Tax=Apiospora rasikravindrae TaxID=990691 RepID=A0ABR1SLU3_9PEZI
MGAEASYKQHSTTSSTAASHVYTTHKTSKGYSAVPVPSKSTLATTLTSYCTNTTISTVIKSSTKHTTSHANVTVPHYTTVPTTKKTTIPVTITETPTCTTTTPPPVITHNSCDQTCSVTSPSVYMLIPTIYGTNTIDGAIVQPTATSAIWAFDLSEVSTIVGGTATQQLSLKDLGTDCPQTAEASAIATMVDSRCDPILAAPEKIRAWASPCAACERFGLFDPPYAIPTITGGLVPTTAVQPPPPPPAPTTTVAPAPTTEAPAPPPTTEAPAPTTAAPPPSITSVITTGPAGVIAVYYENGRAIATSTLAPPPAPPSTATAAPTSAAESAQPTTDAGQPAPSATTATSTVESSNPTTTDAGQQPAPSVTTPAASTSATDGVTSPTPVPTAAANQMKSGVVGLLAAGLLMPLFMNV